VSVRTIAAKPRFPPTESEARGVYADMEKWTEVRRRVLTGELSKRAACPAFGHHVAAERVTHVLDRLAPFRRAQKFPEAASRRIALSSSASARSRFSRAFSFSRSFNRLAWSVRRPPYSRFQR
jgi:hypothetical protein